TTFGVTSMLLVFVAVSFLFPAALSLKCYHNATASTAEYNGLILVSAGSSTFEMGVLKCAKNLERCVNFNRMDISVFKTLDAAKDGNPDFVRQIFSHNQKVAGRACMSNADCDKIKATLEDK
ncbi:hypothetical protein PFISCL1PPCAC_4165, partial [Pristionchus fissidentatus]